MNKIFTFLDTKQVLTKSSWTFSYSESFVKELITYIITPPLLSFLNHSLTYTTSPSSYLISFLSFFYLLRFQFKNRTSKQGRKEDFYSVTKSLGDFVMDKYKLKTLSCKFKYGLPYNELFELKILI